MARPHLPPRSPVWRRGPEDWKVSLTGSQEWLPYLGASKGARVGLHYRNKGADGFTIDPLSMRQNTASSVPAAMQWDELRFATSWAQVTPLP